MAHVLCQFVRGCCSQCGAAGFGSRTCSAGPNAHLLTPKVAAVACEWLGQPTGRIALVQCEGCGGNVRRKSQVHDCALFGECVPKAAGKFTDRGKEYRGCVGCKSSTAATPPTSPPPK